MIESHGTPHTQRTVAPLQQAATDLGDEEGPRACKVYGNGEYGNVGMGIREWEYGNVGIWEWEWGNGNSVPAFPDIVGRVMQYLVFVC